MKNINFVEFGTTRNNLKPRRWASVFMPDIVREKSTEYPEANDGTIHFRNVDKWLRIIGSFEFNFLNPEEYAEAKQIVAFEPFYIKFKHPAILQDVILLVEATENSARLFINSPNLYLGVAGFAFSVRSIYTYRDFQELKNKATNDGRF